MPNTHAKWKATRVHHSARDSYHTCQSHIYNHAHIYKHAPSTWKAEMITQ